MKLRSIVCILVLWLLVAGTIMRALAQDADATPEPVDTPAQPIVVESGGTLVMTDAPDTAPVEATNDTLLWVAVIGFNVLIVGLLILRGGNPDTAATERIHVIQANREAVTAMEDAYARATGIQQQAIDTLAGVLQSVADITPIQLDDALAKLLADIRERGEPALDDADTARMPPASG